MITAEEAWARFERAQARVDRWFAEYEALYEGAVVKLMRNTVSRGARPITKAQAEMMVDALTTPTGYPKLRAALDKYLHYMNEARFYKDVWQAILQRNQPDANALANWKWKNG